MLEPLIKIIRIKIRFQYYVLELLKFRTITIVFQHSVLEPLIKILTITIGLQHYVLEPLIQMVIVLLKVHMKLLK